MSPRTGLIRPLLFGLGTTAGLATALAAGGSLRRLDAVEVEGRSMAPTLLPGDRLLVEDWTFRRRAPARRDLVVVRDPRLASRELVKRVVDMSDGRLELRGDAPDQSTDSRSLGSIPLSAARWRPLLRYWPPLRAGRIR
ncbi:MAG TPA: nickel-type superoxide dismutase maturation protease [Candidatus Limnocylindria bacterium]|nr:nickel-type superoxide dismutase maturation protease [Candidatus Limnocylindria bacterium]